MRFSGAVEVEAARSEIRKFAGVDARTHEPARGMRVRLQQVVTNLVWHGSAKYETESVIFQCHRFLQQLASTFVENPASADCRRNRRRLRTAPSHQLRHGP